MGYQEYWSPTMEKNSTTMHSGTSVWSWGSKPLLITRPPSSQQTGKGYEPILAQDHQDSAWGGKGHLVGGTSEHIVGISNDSKNTHRGYTVSTSIQEWSNHPNRSWTHKLQGGQSWRTDEWQGHAPIARLTRWSQGYRRTKRLPELNTVTSRSEISSWGR